MMAVAISLTKKIVSPEGRVMFEFSDGTSIEFNSESDVTSYVNVESMEQYAPEQLKRYLVGWSRRNSNAVNKTATFDIDNQAGNIVRIQ